MRKNQEFPITPGQWLRTDETHDAVLALLISSELLSKTYDEPHYWKWVIVALHNALQGFMVLALQGSNGVNVLKDECARKWLAAYEQKTGEYPVQELASFPVLYKRIKSDQFSFKPFKPERTQGTSINKLNSLRNDFIHFTPKNWSLEISGLPQITLDCVNTISFLAFNCGTVLWSTEVQEKYTKGLIDHIRELTVKLKKQGFNNG